jgi:uroporphyrinogen-III synthase
VTNPLAGRKIVNTRAMDGAGEFDDLLRERGAFPISYPCIAIAPPDDPAELDAALSELLAGKFDWLILTSANTVRSLATRGMRAPASPQWRTAVVGPATCAAALRELGLASEVMPETYQASDLAEVVPVKSGERILLPQSAIARPDLASALISKGGAVRTVIAYRALTGHGGVRLAVYLARGEIDAVVFASSSAVDGFVSRIADEGLAIDALGNLPVICIGQSTAATARQRGLASPFVPEEQTLNGVVGALESVFAHQPVSKGMIS